MNISEKGVEAIKKFEGVRTKAYQCSAGHWTIGVGHVGPEVTASTVWEMSQVNAIETNLDFFISEQIRPKYASGLPWKV